MSDYSKDYSESGFWDKVAGYAKSIGESTLETAFKMYYSASDPDTPIWAKSTIYGALGYLISPLDAIPDITPIVGYTDDMGVLAAALALVAAHIKDKHVKEAKEKVKNLFD